MQRVVVCAALIYKNCLVLGARHFDKTMHDQIKQRDLKVTPSEWAQGFIDQNGAFMDRFEALKVAEIAGQINIRRLKTEPSDRLFSEDLY